MPSLAFNIAAAAFASLLLAPGAMAQQNVALEQSPTEARAARSVQRKLELERRTREALTGQPVLIYGGFLVDFKQAEKKRQLFSLRQPRDARTDNKHLHLDERSERPKGFVLFSIGF